jgi:glutamyl-tRNA reductase
MNVQVVGCSHHGTSIAVRERLAFGKEQAVEALQQWRLAFHDVEGVLLSTCNRVEIYAASQTAPIPGVEEIGQFLARFHKLDAKEIVPHLFVNSDEAAVRHLFGVAASLDSMVLGEPQILAQVKQAYQAATEREATGPLLHMAFQAAIRVARRVTTETAIHQRRVSIPSVAVADFARQIFERFDDKETLVIGAGDMAEETLRYLRDEGARRITVINRSFERALDRAREWEGRARPWEELHAALAEADLVISTTGAGRPIVALEDFRPIHFARQQRPLFVLDLAVPRSFDPAIGACPEVYLYSVDDLQAACQNNRLLRDKELPAAMRIIDQETRRFMAEFYHRATGPVIQQLREGWDKPKEEELRRLMNRLPDLNERAREEIRLSFDRLVNKLLHPPLESLRDESREGVPHGLLDALARLFHLRD